MAAGVGARIIDADDAFLAIVGHPRSALEAGALTWAALTPPDAPPLGRLLEPRAGRAHAQLLRGDGQRVAALIAPLALRHDDEARIAAQDGAWRAAIIDLGVTAPGGAARDADAGLVLDPPLDPFLGGVLLDELARLRALVDHAPGQLWAVDQDRQLLAANARWQAAQGRTGGRLTHLGEDVLAPRYPADHVEPWRDWYARALAGEHVAVVHAYDVPPHGTFHVEHVVSPIRDPAGGVVGAAATALDVTARVAVERELRALTERRQQHDKLEALGTLAGGIAHDFNNLLGIILGFADRGLAEPAEAADALTAIRSAGQRARDLVQQIVRFGGHHDRAQVAVDLAAVVRDTTRLMRSSLPAVVQLELVAPAAPVIVRGDVAGLQQVLVNLCTNAAYAMRGLPAAVLRVELEATAQVARLAVIDQGPGFPPEHAARLFEPFFTTRPPGEGAGMGLAVVHGIVRALGGEITASTTPEGACFRVVLPLAHEPAAPAAPPAVASPAPAPTRVRIVLAEDEALLRRLIVRGLTAIGHEVQGFGTADEALAAIVAAPDAVDLVITDLTMPGMRGDEFAQRLAALRPTLPVLVISGNAERVDLGASAPRAFLQKPFVPAELRAAIAALLGEGR